MADRVVIIGAGAGGKFAKEILETAGSDPVGYLDNFVPTDTQVLGAPVLGGWDLLDDPSFVSEFSFIITLGNMQARWDVLKMLRARGARLANAIHPGAAVSKYAKIGQGVLINVTAHVLPDAQIADSVQIEGHCSVGVDCVIEENVAFGTGVQINGSSVIESHTFMGACSVVIPKVTVARSCYVGAGAVVTKNTEPGQLLVGMPARVAKPSPWIVSD